MSVKDDKVIFLDKCPFCGAAMCQAHNKYTDRCVDCGKRYTKYANYKSLQQSHPTYKRQRLLEDIIEEYLALRREGFRVPRDIQKMP